MIRCPADIGGCLPSGRDSVVTAHCYRSNKVNRRIQPELLDQLPPMDLRAIRSRCDLRRVNAWMGNAKILSRALQKALSQNSPKRIVELGAGDGRGLLSLAQRTNGSFRNVEAVLVDRQNLLKAETQFGFVELGWNVRALQMDALEFLRKETDPTDAIVANLFLHHFEDEKLKQLFQIASERARVVIAVEPLRSAFSMFFSRLIWLIGCNSVTRHDAVVSVRAGFVGQELSALWEERQDWELTEHRAGLFSHLFVAQRKS